MIADRCRSVERKSWQNLFVEAEGLAKAVVRDNSAEGLFFFGLNSFQIDQLKNEVEVALGKGYFDMDWTNFLHGVC